MRVEVVNAEILLFAETPAEGMRLGKILHLTDMLGMMVEEVESETAALKILPKLKPGPRKRQPAAEEPTLKDGAFREMVPGLKQTEATETPGVQE